MCSDGSLSIVAAAHSLRGRSQQPARIQQAQVNSSRSLTSPSPPPLHLPPSCSSIHPPFFFHARVFQLIAYSPASSPFLRVSSSLTPLSPQSSSISLLIPLPLSSLAIFTNRALSDGVLPSSILCGDPLSLVLVAPSHQEGWRAQRLNDYSASCACSPSAPRASCSKF